MAAPPPSYNEATAFPNQIGNQVPAQGGAMPFQQPGMGAPYPPQQGTGVPYPQQAGVMPFQQPGVTPPAPGAGPYPPQTGKLHFLFYNVVL